MDDPTLDTFPTRASECTPLSASERKLGNPRFSLCLQSSWWAPTTWLLPDICLSRHSPKWSPELLTPKTPKWLLCIFHKKHWALLLSSMQIEMCLRMDLHLPVRGLMPAVVSSRPWATPWWGVQWWSEVVGWNHPFVATCPFRFVSHVEGY